MKFLDFHLLNVIIFTILLVIALFSCLKLSQNKKNNFSEIFLFLSFFFLIINIFDIRSSKINENIEVSQAKILYIMDVSRSMNVRDIHLEWHIISRSLAAKNIITESFKKFPNNLYGLFVFAWETLEVLPFTSDTWFYTTVLSGIDEHNVSKQGTDFTSIFESLESVLTQEHKNSTLVILTDGEDTVHGEIKTDLKFLEELNISVIFTAIGTEKWWNIRLWTDPFWFPIYKMYNWEQVISKVNHNNLEKFAKKYNFSYVKFDNFWKLENFIQILEKKLQFTDNELLETALKDLTVYFVFISFLFFCLFLYCDQIVWKRFF